MLVKVTGELGLTCALKVTSSIVRKCNDYGVKKGCVWRVNPGVNEAELAPARSLMLTHQTWCGQLISSSMRCAVGHQ